MPNLPNVLEEQSLKTRNDGKKHLFQSSPTYSAWLLVLYGHSITAFSSCTRQGSMWFGWPSMAHQLHSLPLKFMKPSSPFASAELGWYCVSETFIIEMRHYDSEPSLRERRPRNHLNTAKGGAEMRFGRLLECTTCFRSHHNMPISMNIKTILLVLSWSSQKSRSVGLWWKAFWWCWATGLCRGRWWRYWIGIL